MNNLKLSYKKLIFKLDFNTRNHKNAALVLYALDRSPFE